MLWETSLELWDKYRRPDFIYRMLKDATTIVAIVICCVGEVLA
jgi:hypothetical protein